MIKIEYSITSIKAEGHTGQKGSSLLCCAVSVLMWGLVNAFQHEGINIDYEANSGYQKVTYKGQRKDEGRRLFNAYANNLRSLANEFPDDISFELKN